MSTEEDRRSAQWRGLSPSKDALPFLPKAQSTPIAEKSATGTEHKDQGQMMRCSSTESGREGSPCDYTTTTRLSYTTTNRLSLIGFTQGFFTLFYRDREREKERKQRRGGLTKEGPGGRCAEGSVASRDGWERNWPFLVPPVSSFRSGSEFCVCVFF
jgi:hypothetical protein